MNHKKYIMDKILFFGAGKIGRYWLECFNDFGIIPSGVIDNNKSLWGDTWENIRIYSPESLRIACFKKIFITCRDEQNIARQLLDLGVAKNKIIVGSHNIWNHLLFFKAKAMSLRSDMEKIIDQFPEGKVLFDLQNGMVLGGVEAWSYELAGKLKKKGWHGSYLTTDAANPDVKDETYPVYTLAYRGLEQERDKINLCVQEIINHLPCTIICNFPQHIFWSACIVKRLYPKQIKIIAVQHSDDSVYYEAYSLWKDSIDKCMVISSYIERKLLSYGMNQNKLQRLEWQIPCRKNLKKEWYEIGQPLQIGYAGRITTLSKRVDLLLVLAERLKKKNIDFQMNIAGTGDYSEILMQKIQEQNLQESVILTGYIDRESISAFWNRQDIMVSCSEREGHSISQCEAMAQGAVPVITDVSGARDDVVDGFNGYVVDVGDMDTLADRIQELYVNRDKLIKMGTCAHNTIYERQKDNDQAEFWDQLIKKVWQG